MLIYMMLHTGTSMMGPRKQAQTFSMTLLDAQCLEHSKC